MDCGDAPGEVCLATAHSMSTVAAPCVEPEKSAQQSDEPPSRAQRAPLSEVITSHLNVEMQVEELVGAE
eukprot:1710272-Prymnesium_polylepis.1